MLLGNVGLQVFNNWCNNRQNDELQRKREEFERSAREHQTDRMWKILREGQALTLELEKTKQEQRIEELESEMGQLLQTLAYQATVENWPLNVLPIVMKNQALGNLLAHQEESFALHCIFTPSNYNVFNRCVYPRIELALEEYCNKYWSPAGTHPILFYSGAWKSNDAPSGTQTNSMRSALSNLPTLMITPFFRPTDGKLVFQIQMWGVGASSTDQFDVPEIEPKSDEFHFQRTYTNKLDYEKETGLLDEIVEDLVPYLQCLIGFMADTYFWSSAGLKPQLPHLVTNGTINTDGMKYLVSDSREYYNNLLLTGEERAKENPFAQDNMLNLYEGCSELWDENSRKRNLEKCFVNYCNRRMACEFSAIEDAITNSIFTYIDLPFIEAYLSVCKNTQHIELLNKIKENLKINAPKNTITNDIPSVLNETNLSNLLKLADQGNPIAYYRLGELYEYSIGVEYNPEESDLYYKKSNDSGFLLANIRYKIVKGIGAEITKEDIAFLDNNKSIQSTLFKAICFYKGFYLEQSVERAMNELEKISESTHPYVFYLSSQIVKEQYGEDQRELLVELLLKAANMGYVQAQLDLMNIYNEGKYVAENPQQCVEFAKKAALQGHPEALLTLAICSLRGYGITANKPKAIELLNMAATRGNEDAVDILNAITK